METSPEIVHERMIARNSDRDIWKLAHWDEYIASCDFSIPENLDDPKVKDDLILFQNNNEEEFEASMQNCLHILRGHERLEISGMYGLCCAPVYAMLNTDRI